MTSDSQAGLLPERGDQGGTALHGFEASCGERLDFVHRVAAQVGQFVLLGISPDIFRRVQFRGIARQVFHHDLPIGRRQIISHQRTAMTGQSIPNDEQLAPGLLQQTAQEVHDLFFLDGALHKAKVKLPLPQCRYHCQMAPVEAVAQQRRLALGCPGSDTRGPFAQSGLIQKENESSLSAGFFLTSASACAAIPKSPSRHAGWPAPWGAGKKIPRP